MYIYGGFPKRVYPQIIHLNRISTINLPFGVSLIYGTPRVEKEMKATTSQMIMS